MPKTTKLRIAIIFLNLLLIVTLTQCTLPINLPEEAQEFIDVENEAVTQPPQEEITPLPETKIEIIFRVQIPEREQNTLIYVDLLDEVTGLALNSRRYPMERINDRLYETRLAFQPGTLVKYRYARDGNPIAIEHNAFGEQVRFRMVHVTNPAEVNDLVAGWNDQPYQGDTGRILGHIKDISSNPIPDILVTAGGVTTISTSDGTFLLEGIPPGTHSLVACSINGDYLPYQQGALVAANSTTPAPLVLPPTHLVNITFILKLPDDFIQGLPVRIIGNTYSLGNTFANLQGGTSIIASRAPFLTPMEDGRYSITLSLPAGLDLRYKYTLGDGFWNTEHRNDGSFRIRQLIIPESDQTIEDNISSFQVASFEPVIFQLTVPDTTPNSDVISIQFNPYAWTQPIPMWPTGQNQWMYVLYSPMHLLSSISYRYCRNEQCEVAEPAAVISSLDEPILKTDSLPGTITDSVIQWSWTELQQEETKIVGMDVQPRGDQFIAGVEMLDYFDPSYSAYQNEAFHNIQSLGANWVYVSPTWHFSSVNPPVLQAIPGKDLLWHDLSGLIQSAEKRNLNVAIFPQSKWMDNEQSWAEGEKDAAWWQTWFDRYRIFLLHFADFAEQTQSGALVLGESGMLPAFPGGQLPNGESSNVPVDAYARWENIIEEVRNRYSGKLVFAVHDPAQLDSLEGVFLEFDEYYLLTSAPLVNEAGEANIQEMAANVLDELHPFWEKTQKAIVIGIKYPSTESAVNGCIQHNDECLPFDVLDQPATLTINTTLNLSTQFKIYEAFLSAINEREWITGFVSRGYYPPAELQDLSSSIHGKPAAAILWYWYPRFLAK